MNGRGTNEPVPDATLTRGLAIYAGMVHRILDDPGRWLGLDDVPPPSAPFPRRALHAVRDRAFGDITPASPRWNEKPQKKRIEWWLRRITVSAGLAAAVPRLAGALADRIPLGSALSSAAAGLAVCATAREYGHTQPEQWVPLLAKILLDRDLPAPTPEVAEAVPAPVEAEDLLAADPADPADPAEPVDDQAAPPHGSTQRVDRRGRREPSQAGPLKAAGSIWRLARALWDLQSMLDERPRGSLLSRGIAKLPVAGIVGGLLDERGGIRKASKQAGRMLR